jgi:trimethylamine--corrinoid protein Co-methyltransferase
MANCLIAGIAQKEDPIALDFFKDFTSETQFLSMPHTRRWYRDEHIFPKVIDRDTYDYWSSLGKKSIAERANEEVEKLLIEHPPDVVDQADQEDLRTIMLSDAKACGLTKLPEKGFP